MRRAVLGFFVAVSMACAPLVSYADTASQQATLQAQLNALNEQIAENQAKLAQQEAQRQTYQNEVDILDSKIKEDQLEIQQRNLTITQLNDSIADKQAGIDSLDSQVAAGEASLAQILRRTREIDDIPFAERALQGSFSELFNDVSDFETIQRALGASFTQMATQRADLAARKQALQDQQQEQQNLLQAQVLQQNSLKATEQQKQDLVNAVKGQESIYQQLIANQQKTAAQIESALFTLRDTSSVSFGKMYDYAKEASGITGVPPAFILGILSEESDLGQNVGRCTYQQAMNPKRDVPVFLQLMDQLGLDPNAQKVSCAPSYGYGGAMGPAQFIPSTWQLYQARIAKASGQNPPNPWDPRTAVFATAIYMGDLGADAGTASAERTAALKYFAGSHWQNRSYAFYGNDVMCLTNQVQQEINVLEGNPNPGPQVSC
jgi:membrane-bound lytic murein transglycosylase B